MPIWQCPKTIRTTGDSGKASSFRAVALEVYPEIEAARKAGKLTVRDGMTARPVKPAATPERPAGTEPSAVRYYFSKLMRAVFTENSRNVMSLLSTRLYLPGYDQGVSRDEVETYLNGAFEKYPLDRTDPSGIYNFKRYFVKKEGSTWTVRINLTPEGIEIMDKELGFPGEAHIFYFREYREGWRLIAINGE